MSDKIIDIAVDQVKLDLKLKAKDKSKKLTQDEMEEMIRYLINRL